MRRALLIILLGSFSEVILACSCVRPSEDLEEDVRVSFERAKAVAIAEAVSVAPSEVVTNLNGVAYSHSEEITEFAVHQAFKGIHSEIIYTKINTECCMCGRTFTVGETYLLYLYRRQSDEYFTTSICSRTTSIDSADEELALIGELADES